MRIAPTADLNVIDSQVTQDGEGNLFLSCDLPVNVADELIAALRTNGNPALTPVIDALAATLCEAYTALITDVLGCPDMLPGADTITLEDYAILGSTDGILSVLLPGKYSTLDAAVKGFGAVQTTASERGIDLDDPNLTVNVHPAEWMTLLHCDAEDHDFHPQQSDASDPGASLVTRVDLELVYAPAAGVPAYTPVPSAA